MLPLGTPRAVRHAHLVETLDAQILKAKAEMAAEAKEAQGPDSSAPGAPRGPDLTFATPIHSPEPLSPEDSARNARANASSTAEAPLTPGDDDAPPGPPLMEWQIKQREYEVKKARAKALKLRLTCTICGEKAKLNCPCGTTQY